MDIRFKEFSASFEIQRRLKLPVNNWKIFYNFTLRRYIYKSDTVNTSFFSWKYILQDKYIKINFCIRCTSFWVIKENNQNFSLNVWHTTCNRLNRYWKLLLYTFIIFIYFICFYIRLWRLSKKLLKSNFLSIYTYLFTYVTLHTFSILQYYLIWVYILSYLVCITKLMDEN